MRHIAIGDVHGCKRTLELLLFRRLEIVQTDHVYFLGDLIDRGPDSKGVLDMIFELKKEGVGVTCLMGNHEYMMIDALTDYDKSELWFRNGAAATLASFMVVQIDEIPANYFNFLEEMILYTQSGNYLLVHAGFNFEADLPFKDQHAMMWIRNWEIDEEKLGNRVVVHGHTPTSRKDIERNFADKDQKVIVIDAGCVYQGKFLGMGHLCAFDMTGNQLFFQVNVDF